MEKYYRLDKILEKAEKFYNEGHSTKDERIELFHELVAVMNWRSGEKTQVRVNEIMDFMEMVRDGER